MNELLPCPFCGCTAIYVTHTHYYDDEDTVCVFCNGCKSVVMLESNEAEGINDKTRAEAIAAWNTRTEYHGYEQAAIEAWESIKKWNTRAERTCHIVEKQKELQDNVLVRDYTLSCGHTICWAHTYEPRYCPNCGARVVGESHENR